MRQALEHYPRGTHLSTIIRHVTRGIQIRGGSVVKLEACRMGARWTTTVGAIERFRDRLTAAAGAEPPVTMTRSQSHARAEAFLEAIGF
jgi:hypothetical protein